MIGKVEFDKKLATVLDEARKGKSEEEKAAWAQTMNDERMVKTTPEERSEAARTAVQARWAKAKKKAVKKKKA